MALKLPFLSALVLLLTLGSSAFLDAQILEWGKADEFVLTRNLGTIETDTGTTALYLEYRSKAPGRTSTAPRQLIFLKNRPAPLEEFLQISGQSQPTGYVRDEEVSLQQVSGPKHILQILYQGKTGVPRLSDPQNAHPWNVVYDRDSLMLSFRWQDDKSYYAEWGWDDSLRTFIPAGFTSYITPWSADSSASLHRRTFSDVPVYLMKKVHGLDPTVVTSDDLPYDWRASGNCMVRTRIWDNFYRDELHGHFSIRYSTGKDAPEKPKGEATILEIEGSWMEGNIPFGPMRIEATFDNGTVIKAMLRYVDFDDPLHTTGSVLWANASCLVPDKNGRKAYSIYLDHLRNPTLPVIIRQLRKTHGASIPKLYMPKNLNW